MGKTFDQLDAIAALAAGDLFAVDDISDSKTTKVTGTQLITFIESQQLDGLQLNEAVALAAMSSELNTAADGISDPPIAGDSTAGRVLRVIKLTISDGTNANTIECETESTFNGDVIAAVDNIPSGSETGGFLLSSIGLIDSLTIKASVLSGDCVGVLSVFAGLNATGTHMTIAGFSESSTDLKLEFRQAPNGSNANMKSLVDTGNLELYITYLTDA